MSSARIPNLAFDASGVCTICRERDEQPAADYPTLERRFADLMARQKAKGRRFDLVLGFSGGKDSAYALHLLRRYAVTPLVVRWDNGFPTDWGRRVVAAAERRFGVVVERHRAPEASYRAAVRAAFLRTGDVCLPCDLEVYALLYRVARAHDLDVIVVGGGASEGLTQASPVRAIDVFRYAERHFADAEIDCSRFRIDEELVRGIELVQLGDYFAWDHGAIARVLREELGVPVNETDAGYVHAECGLCRVQDHCRWRKRGFSRLEPSLSALVRSGTMSRATALGLLEANEVRAAMAPAELEVFSARFGIDRATIEAVLADDRIQYRPPWFHGEPPDER